MCVHGHLCRAGDALAQFIRSRHNGGMQPLSRLTAQSNVILTLPCCPGPQPIQFIITSSRPLRFQKIRSQNVANFAGAVSNLDWGSIVTLSTPSFPVFRTGETNRKIPSAVLVFSRGIFLCAYEILPGLIGLVLCAWPLPIFREFPHTTGRSLLSGLSNSQSRLCIF